MIDKLIDDLGTSNLNIATIRNRLLTLREQAEAVDSQLNVLHTRLEEIEATRQAPKIEPEQQRFDKDAERFLESLFDDPDDEGIPVEFISQALRISKGMAEHHRNTLLDAEMIQWARFGALILTPKGTAYCVDVLGKK